MKIKNKLLYFIVTLIYFTLNGTYIPKDIDRSLDVKKMPAKQHYYLFYQDDNIKIYHCSKIDTNKVFLIPATKVYCDLAYFSKINKDNNFKVY